jgi:hypothetical protein
LGRTLAVPPPFSETVLPGGVWLPTLLRLAVAVWPVLAVCPVALLVWLGVVEWPVALLVWLGVVEWLAALFV